MNDFDTEFAKIQDEYLARPKDELLSRITADGTKAVIFGSGAVGNSLAGSLRNLGGNIAAFCDNFKTGVNEQYQIPIISPEKLPSYKDAVIIVAVDYKYNDEIYNQVLELGIPKENIFRRYSGYELYDIDNMKQYYEGYKWAYNFFEDETSKKIVLDRIRSYLFYHEMAHSPCKEQYFEQDVIPFSDDEVFIDGGCYIGDTALEFIRRKNQKYRRIYCFEPDAENFEQAKLNLKSYKNIEVVNKGLWDKEDILSFCSGSSSSKITDKGTVSISLTSLDNYFSGKPEEELPTFIKLDIEGAEKQAIMGSREIIKKSHPKLAVCVYHKPEDIYELPKIIMELGNYKYTLRHYSKGDVETVLYAV
jgi:FkbM family methyltransferase